MERSQPTEVVVRHHRWLKVQKNANTSVGRGGGDVGGGDDGGGVLGGDGGGLGGGADDSGGDGREAAPAEVGTLLVGVWTVLANWVVAMPVDKAVAVKVETVVAALE
eukprot:6200520-Pleurochrysis_carterae.AAC.1